MEKLLGGVAKINVGAVPESELKKQRFLYEDAINAGKAAIVESVVAGGGVSHDEEVGYNIVRRGRNADGMEAFLMLGRLADSAPDHRRRDLNWHLAWMGSAALNSPRPKAGLRGLSDGNLVEGVIGFNVHELAAGA